MSFHTQKIMDDPSVHYWVKEQYLNAINRDILDALDDAKLLVAMLQDRLDYTTANLGRIEEKDRGVGSHE